jgi:DHA1 family tetracycline resistance protein-like MFS transporter
VFELIATLKNLRGNARGCVYTEPLWGIPYNLYIPYVSIYMRSLGMADHQIGLIISIGMAFQIVAALMSGVITDKLGRKRTTLIFDFFAWTIPTLIWAISQNFNYFLIAAIINSMWRITMNSWTCLLVEDTDQNQLISIYSWIYISGLLAAFFAPLAGVLIGTFSLVPTMRGLFVFAAIMMTTKFIVMNFLVKETRQGVVRMQETKNQSILLVLSEYRGVFKDLLRTQRTLLTIGIMLVVSICGMVSNTFWSLLVTEKVLIPAQNLALFPFLRSGVMLLFFLFIIPRLGGLHFRQPMLIGIVGYLISLFLLIIAPEKSYLILIISVLVEACSLAMVSPFLDKMLVVTVDAQERARIMAIMYVIVIVLTAPFGWIVGNLSEINRILPFILSMVLFAIGALLTLLAGRASDAAEFSQATTDQSLVDVG